MTASSHVTLWCDAIVPAHELKHLPMGGAPAPVVPEAQCPEWTDQGASTASVTRKLAKAEGWTHRDGYDYCPAHSRS